MNAIILWVTLIVTGFLCILNATFVYLFRKRQKGEVFSYVAAGSIELLVFVTALLLRAGALPHIPYRLPASLPVTRTELAAALAVGIGLFPAAYWHRMSFSQLRARMAEDAKVMREREGRVQVRRQAPGEWMN